jgi:hypothetical protein
MILRRVMQHVRDQDWTAIAIDFVIVVIGVFVGIQVSNWNATMIERREARASMQQLESDLRLSIELTRGGMEFMAQNAEYADLVFERLRACELPDRDRDAFASGLYRLGKITSARFVRTTFDELRDSGRLRLIGNPALREQLDEAARRQEAHEVVFRLIAARMDPHMAYIDSQVIYDIDSAVGGDADIGRDQLDIDFAAACKDRRFLAAVGAARNYTYDNIADVRRLQRRFEMLLALVQKENAQ